MSPKAVEMLKQLEEIRSNFKKELEALFSNQSATNNEWDEITHVFQKAIDRKGLSEEEVLTMVDTISSECRGKTTT